MGDMSFGAGVNKLKIYSGGVISLEITTVEEPGFDVGASYTLTGGCVFTVSNNNTIVIINPGSGYSVNEIPVITAPPSHAGMTPVTVRDVGTRIQFVDTTPTPAATAAGTALSQTPNAYKNKVFFVPVLPATNTSNEGSVGVYGQRFAPYKPAAAPPAGPYLPSPPLTPLSTPGGYNHEQLSGNAGRYIGYFPRSNSKTTTIENNTSCSVIRLSYYDSSGSAYGIVIKEPLTSLGPGSTPGVPIEDIQLTWEILNTEPATYTTGSLKINHPRVNTTNRKFEVSLSQLILPNIFYKSYNLNQNAFSGSDNTGPPTETETEQNGLVEYIGHLSTQPYVLLELHIGMSSTAEISITNIPQSFVFEVPIVDKSRTQDTEFLKFSSPTKHTMYLDLSSNITVKIKDQKGNLLIPSKYTPWATTSPWPDWKDETSVFLTMKQL